MNTALAYYVVTTLRDDLARASTHPSQLMRHEQRYAGTSRKRRRWRR